MPVPDSLGASGRFFEIDDLASQTYPLYWQPLAIALFPDDPTLRGQAVSRGVLAMGGSGYLDLITTMGGIVSPIQFEDGEINGVQTVGLNAAPTGPTMLKVYL